MIINSYSQLKEIINLFGKVNLIIISKAGLGKSKLFKKIIKKDYLEISSHLTPLAFYREFFHYAERHNFKNINILIDDCDNIEGNSLLVSLLKRASENEEKIKMHYHSSRIIKEGLPETYDLENVHVAIMGNSFKRLNKNRENIEALSDRMLYVKFNPSSLRVLNYLKTFAKEKTVLSFLEKYYQYSNNFSLRTYVKCMALKKYVKDWKRIILNDMDVNLENIKLNKILNSKIKRSLKVKKVAKLKKISERQARNIIKKLENRK